MAMEILNHVKKNGLSGLMDKYEHFASEIQEALLENKKALAKVKKNPWAYMGAAAGCALLIGFILGKSK